MNRGSTAAGARPQGSAASPTPPTISETLSRFLPYYQACVDEDERMGVKVFLSDEGRKFLVPPVGEEWSSSNPIELTLDIRDDQWSLAKSLRQQRGTSGLSYGYPLYVDWVARSAKGWTGGFAIPVFLLPVDFSLSGSVLTVRLEPGWPRINGEFLSAVLRTAEERRLFMQEIGLLDERPSPPTLADLARGLSATSAAAIQEPLDPTAIPRVPPIATLRKAGFYNRAMLAVGERPKFTAGLERELKSLASESALKHLPTTALRSFFTDAAADDAVEPSTAFPQLELVALNDEQRAAVKSAAHARLTVVTGPPGTGKSQVVVSILANAYLRGERVLFTSRNNKAVDVVEARLNGLSAHPLIVRLGVRAGDKNLRAELARFLGQVLSITAADDDRRRYADAQATVERLIQRRDELWERVESVRMSRNHVDALDRALDVPRARLGEAKFHQLSTYRGDRPASAAVVEGLKRAQRQSGEAAVTRRLRRRLSRGADAKYLVAAADPFRASPDVFGAIPGEGPPQVDWQVWVAALEGILERVDALSQLDQFAAAFTQLEDGPNLDQFATELSEIEEQLWDWGARLVAAYGQLLPERLTAQTRRAVGEYRACVERLAADVGVAAGAYAQILTEMERLFGSVTGVLPLWCVTNLSARGSLPFDHGLFDLVVIDEASQCDIPSALPLLYRAKRAVIIGDPQQLRHISNLEQHRAQVLESQHGLTSAADQPYSYVNNSLFDLAVASATDARVMTLREHFRSHHDIVGFSNRTWYRNTLQICTDYRRLARVPDASPGISWTQTAGEVQKPAAGGAVCPEEAVAVVRELEDLLVRRRFTGSVGVVTPFRAQANRIRDLVNERLDNQTIERCDLIVDTAHGFQGDERDVILFSPCVGPGLARGAEYFLSSTGNLFNVALTRARALLHVVGDQEACAKSSASHIAGFASFVRQLGQDGKSHVQSWRGRSQPEVGYWEQAFYEALVAVGLNPVSQYPLNQYRLDLAILDGPCRLDIEIDGEQYHRDWDGNRCRADVVRDMRVSAQGWAVKRFWVYRVRDDRQACVREVLETLADLRSSASERHTSVADRRQVR